MSEAVAIRCMSRAEIDLLVDWAAAEGWNPGLADALAFHAADPEGFLVAVVDGMPAGAVSAVRYGHRHGFLGFYIVAPTLRGRGLGLALWTAAMTRLAGRTVGLDGVPAQQANYQRSGFAFAWRNVRFEGDVPEIEALPALPILDARTVPFDGIAALDRAFFPTARDGFLSPWIGLAGHRAVVAVEDGLPVGFAVARLCRRGTKIGPLYASTPAMAVALLGAMDEPRLLRPLILDVPEPNTKAVRLAEALGMRPAFETARMYAGGPVPQIALERLFGITTFELG